MRRRAGPGGNKSHCYKLKQGKTDHFRCTSGYSFEWSFGGLIKTEIGLLFSGVSKRNGVLNEFQTNEVVNNSMRCLLDTADDKDRKLLKLLQEIQVSILERLGRTIGRYMSALI